MLIRHARIDDTVTLAAVLERVIAEGDKTAIDTPLSPAEFAEWFVTGAHCVSCIAAFDEAGRAIGFQALERFHDDLPDDAADIATFVAAARRGAGVGRALTEATLREAASVGLGRLRAVIRRANVGARHFYAGIGFTPDDAAVEPDQPSPGSTSVIVWRTI